MSKQCNIAAPITSANGITINRSRPAHSSNYDNMSSRNIEYIVMHYTGNNEDSAAGNANYFMGANRDASAHYFVDNYNIYQCVDANDIAWHCGSSRGYYHHSCRNSNSIGIEMCCSGNYRVSDTTKANAVQLVAELCRYLGITDVDKYIVRHYDVTRKSCPAQMAGGNNSEWKAFKAAIKEAIKPKVSDFKVGDVITFIGKTHYKSANALAGSACSAGEAKITAISEGAKHPYHLVKTGGSSATVHGWVNAADVTTLEVETVTYRVGDVVDFIGNKHYKSSKATMGSACKAGDAKITAINNNGTHPYHIVAVPGGTSNVYGWVNATDIKAKEPVKPVVTDTTIDSVKEVQVWLNKTYGAGLEVDGEYGPMTQAALIKLLQRGIGVDDDGVYGPATHSAINNLYVGSYGKDVEALQGLLVCNGYPEAYVDGGFGNDTKAAVIAYQRSKGLYPDGIAGQDTFGSLCDY